MVIFKSALERYKNFMKSMQNPSTAWGLFILLFLLLETRLYPFIGV